MLNLEEEEGRKREQRSQRELPRQECAHGHRRARLEEEGGEVGRPVWEGL